MIKKLKNGELETAMRIWLKTNIEAHNFINESYWQGNYDLVKEMLPSAEIFVYEDNNTMQGFIGLQDTYIAGIFINAANQSKGIGKSLLDYVKANHSKLLLHVYKKDARAVKFYIREDFIALKEQVDENTGEIEIVMNWVK